MLLREPILNEPSRTAGCACSLSPSRGDGRSFEFTQAAISNDGREMEVAHRHNWLSRMHSYGRSEIGGSLPRT
jgi:hypothetical protein